MEQFPQAVWDRVARAIDGTEPMTVTATAEECKHTNTDSPVLGESLKSRKLSWIGGKPRLLRQAEEGQNSVDIQELQNPIMEQPVIGEDLGCRTYPKQRGKI
jgi:hypothetical protein